MSTSGRLHVLYHHRGQSPTAPTVVLVHGSLDRATSFTRVVRRLPDLHVVTYDRRGYNHSRDTSAPAGGIDDHVADLVALAGRGPVVAVGHSFGGDVAIGAALVAPDAVVAVGAYEPPLPWLDWWPRRHRPADQDPGEVAEAFFRRMVGDAAWDRLPERAQAERRADGKALAAELTSLRSGAPPFDVGALAVPLVLGRGSKSIPHHRRAAEELASLVRGSTIAEIDGAAHGAHLTHPGGFADFVRVVLARAQARAGG